MRTSFYQCAIVALGLLILTPGAADAGRRNRSNSYGYSSSYSTPTVTQASSSPTAPAIFVGKLWKQTRTDRTEYDYNWAARRSWHNKTSKQWLFSDRLQIKLNLRDDLAKIEDSLKVKMTWNYMHRSKHITETWATIQQDGDDRFIELTGLDEGRLIHAKLEIFRPTNPAAAEANPAAAEANPAAAEGQVTIAPVSMNTESEAPAGYERVGAIHAPYFGVTSSVTNEEWKRRARIISFGFSQWYHDEAYGGRYCNYDCWSFIKKSADSELAGFTKKSVSNSDVPRLSKEGKRFHGDFLTMSGHYGMALCYDEDRDHFCSIEGNYALSGPHRIQIDQHYHGLYTWHTIMSLTETPQAKAKPIQVISSMD